jgi:hypothetical protein
VGRIVLGQSADEILKHMGDFFMKRDPVHQTMQRLTTRLKEEQIPYAVIGGMALGLHGFERVTGDVDILTTREGLEAIHKRLIGRGYLPAFQGARKKIRDTQTGVNVDFITTGEYPGDGKPKAIAYPDPTKVSVEREGKNVIDLPKLIELKLASGMTGGIQRLRDLSDVMDLIMALKLPRDLGNELDPLVRDKYLEMWEAWKNRPTTAPDYEPDEE